MPLEGVTRITGKILPGNDGYRQPPYHWTTEFAAHHARDYAKNIGDYIEQQFWRLNQAKFSQLHDDKGGYGPPRRPKRCWWQTRNDPDTISRLKHFMYVFNRLPQVCCARNRRRLRRARHAPLKSRPDGHNKLASSLTAPSAPHPIPPQEKGMFPEKGAPFNPDPKAIDEHLGCHGLATGDFEPQPKSNKPLPPQGYRSGKLGKMAGALYLKLWGRALQRPSPFGAKKVKKDWLLKVKEDWLLTQLLYVKKRKTNANPLVSSRNECWRDFLWPTLWLVRVDATPPTLCPA